MIQGNIHVWTVSYRKKTYNNFNVSLQFGVFIGALYFILYHCHNYNYTYKSEESRTNFDSEFLAINLWEVKIYQNTCRIVRHLEDLTFLIFSIMKYEVPKLHISTSQADGSRNQNTESGLALSPSCLLFTPTLCISSSGKYWNSSN